MLPPKGTFSGCPETNGDVADADSVLMMEVGSHPGLRTNQDIIDFTYGDERLAGLPKFVSGSIAKALEARRYSMEGVRVFKGPSAAGMHENTGTFGELSQLVRYRQTHPGEFERPVLVTNGHNAPNIMRQAGILEIDEDIIVPRGLPRRFDIRSLLHGQIWTAHKLFWVAGAIPRDYLLRRNGH